MVQPVDNLPEQGEQPGFIPGDGGAQQGQEKDVPPQRLWAEQGTVLMILAGVLVASTVLVAMQTILKHQTLAINFPLQMRWNFHRLMLGQSMAFYSDEFAGRITTKVMQTALAVRETIFTSTD